MHDLAVRGTTLREGLSLAFQFMGFACPAAHFRLIEDDSVATIEIEIESNGQDDDHLLIQWQMLTMHKLAQWQTGSEIVLDHVTFPNAMQAPYGDYAVMFGGKCEFNAPAASLSFAAHHLDLRIVRTPADLDRQFNAPKGNFAEPKTLSKSWQQRVKRLLRSDLSAERPLSTIDDLADEFRISSQTLRRRLKHEGTSYRELKADVRREAALDAMSGEDAPLSQASLRAGFAEANGLTRALRTSAGLSSTDLRGQVRAWRAH
jgi:AraC-like DNA-binding protein